MSAADRQAARVLGAPIVTEPDPLPPAPACSEALGPAATGSLYLDPADGELVQVMPPSAWLHERWGPATPGLAVCRVLASAPRYEATGEIVQRDLRGCLLLRDAAGRVPAALRALAGGGALASLATAAAERADARYVGIDPGCYGGAVRTLVERGADGGIRPAQPSEPRAAMLEACRAAWRVHTGER